MEHVSFCSMLTMFIYWVQI